MKSVPFRVIKTSPTTGQQKAVKQKRPYNKIENEKRVSLLNMVRLISHDVDE